MMSHDGCSVTDLLGLIVVLRWTPPLNSVSPLIGWQGLSLMIDGSLTVQSCGQTGLCVCVRLCVRLCVCYIPGRDKQREGEGLAAFQHLCSHTHLNTPGCECCVQVCVRLVWLVFTMKIRSCRATCMACCNRKVTEGSSTAPGGSTFLHSGGVTIFGCSYSSVGGMKSPRSWPHILMMFQRQSEVQNSDWSLSVWWPHKGFYFIFKLLIRTSLIIDISYLEMDSNGLTTLVSSMVVVLLFSKSTSYTIS